MSTGVQKCPIRDDEYNYHDSLQAHIIRGIGHFRAVERARALRWSISVASDASELYDCVLV